MSAVTAPRIKVVLDTLLLSLPSGLGAHSYALCRYIAKQQIDTGHPVQLNPYRIGNAAGLSRQAVELGAEQLFKHEIVEGLGVDIHGFEVVIVPKLSAYLDITNEGTYNLLEDFNAKHLEFLEEFATADLEMFLRAAKRARALTSRLSEWGIGVRNALLEAVPEILAERQQSPELRPVPKIEAQIPPMPPSKAVGVPKGYVYLLRSVSGHYKIGRSRNPNNRLKTFSVKLPFEVEYECLIPTDDMSGLERELHDQFASRRVNGEWFSLSADEVEYIKGLAE